MKRKPSLMYKLRNVTSENFAGLFSRYCKYLNEETFINLLIQLSKRQWTYNICFNGNRDGKTNPCLPACSLLVLHSIKFTVTSLTVRNTFCLSRKCRRYKNFFVGHKVQKEAFLEGFLCVHEVVSTKKMTSLPILVPQVFCILVADSVGLPLEEIPLSNYKMPVTFSYRVWNAAARRYRKFNHCITYLFPLSEETLLFQFGLW